MTRTKKVGSTGRFGARYGLTIKQKVLAIEKKTKTKYECPSCLKPRVKRVSKGVWSCTKCNHKFAGGTFYLGGA
mgnify:CR=1 FL=1